MALSDADLTILRTKGKQYNLPESVWRPIINHESGENKFAVGDNGNSHGLFQVNKSGGMHSDFDTSRLNDVGYQADYFMPTLSKVYKEAQAKGLSGVDAVLYVEKEGERPLWNSSVISSITGYYNKFKNAVGGVVRSITDIIGGLVTGGGTISSNFGDTAGRKSPHKGVDIASPTGSQIKSQLGGKVIFAGDAKDGYGNKVIVQTSEGVQELFGHMSAIDVSVGSSIQAGGNIGKVGSTGDSSGSHLHYEIIKNGTNLNPLDFLKNAVGFATDPVGSVANGIGNIADGIMTQVKGIIQKLVVGQAKLSFYMISGVFIIVALIYILRPSTAGEATEVGKQVAGAATNAGGKAIKAAKKAYETKSAFKNQQKQATKRAATKEGKTAIVDNALKQAFGEIKTRKQVKKESKKVKK